MQILIILFIVGAAEAQTTSTVAWREFTPPPLPVTPPPLPKWTPPGPRNFSSFQSHNLTEHRGQNFTSKNFTDHSNWRNFTRTTPVSHSHNFTKNGNWTTGRKSNSTAWPRNSTFHSTTPKPTTTVPPVTIPPGPVITSPSFTDFEELCPDNLPVRAISYKPIFNGTFYQRDFELKALCFPKVTYDNGSALNLSSADCEYRKAFSLEDDQISENDTSYMCAPGEYINGAQSQYWKGARLLRIRCCISPLLHYSLDHGCNDWRFEQTKDIIQTKTSPKCPIDVLTAVRVSNDLDDLTVRYCGLAVKDSKYSAVCVAERKLALDRIRTPKQPVKRIPFNVGFPFTEKNYVLPGNQTGVNSDFTFNCTDYEAIDSVDVQRVGNDFVFRFTCKPVVPKMQEHIDFTTEDFQPMSQIVDSDQECAYRSDYVMCGVDSYVGQNNLDDMDDTRDRNYAFKCCQLPNAIMFAKMDMEVQNTTLDKKGHALVTRPGFFLEKMHIIYNKNSKNPPILITGWSAYNLTKPGNVFSRRTKMTMNGSRKTPNMDFLMIIVSSVFLIF